MKTRVSLALAGLGVTVLRRSGVATDLLLSGHTEGKGHAKHHPHRALLVVPKRHYYGSTIPGSEEKDRLVFDVHQRDIRLIGMPEGSVSVTRGLRKDTGGGKRQDRPDTPDAWRDVAWTADFDHIEKRPVLKNRCFSSTPREEIAARVYLTGGVLEAGLPRHICLRRERWHVFNSEGDEADFQVIADTMHHRWETDASELTVTIADFGGTPVGAVFLVPVGGAISGVVVQSRPEKTTGGDEKCGKGTMEHYPHLYDVLQGTPGWVEIEKEIEKKDKATVQGFRVDENKRCGRAIVSESADAEPD